MADETKRVIDQTTDSSLSAGDYVIVDSESEGTRKFDLGTELTDIKEDLQALIDGGAGLTEEAKQALLNCFAHVYWNDDNGQDYYDSLESALYPPTTLSYITCIYTQSGVVHEEDSLDSLKTNLVVTAHYSDGTTGTVTSYVLNGTLSIGTSTITVSYSQKTTTFDVIVSEWTLDDIAYGSLTYRDIFITNNEVLIGDFEDTLNISSTEVDLGNGYYYKSNAGSPTQTTEAYASPTHSLKCYGSSSTQIVFGSTSKIINANQKYLVCASVNVTRYSAGYAGGQFNLSYVLPTVQKVEIDFQNTTDGFEPMVKMITPSTTITGFRFFLGSYSSANLDCYVDDVVFTPVPNELTEEEALSLYKKYLEIRGATV